MPYKWIGKGVLKFNAIEEKKKYVATDEEIPSEYISEKLLARHGENIVKFERVVEEKKPTKKGGKS